MRWPRLLPMVVLLAASAPASAQPAKRVTLPNDLRVVIKSTWSTEIVAIEMLLDISCLDEPPDKNGLRHLVQRLLLRGTTHESGDAINRRLAAVGGVMDTGIGLDYVEVYALVPADGFEVALPLLADVIRSPAFLPEEIARESIAAQETARAAREDPFQETYLAFREALYADHPYGRPTFGDPRSLAALTREDLVAFHTQHYRPNRAVLAICGGVGEARAMRAARDAFGDWVPGGAPPRRDQEVPPLPSSLVVARELPMHSTHLMLGFEAPAAGAPRYYPTQVLDSLLSGGASARLPQRLRDELGLVYQASSFYPTLSEKSHFAIYAVTGPPHVESVKTAVLETLTDLCQEPVPPQELARAKRYLLGSYALGHQRMKDQAYALAWYEILGLGGDFEERYADGVNAVTVPELQQTAQALLRHFALVVTMPTT